MSDEESWIAVSKGYCVINILFIPFQFANGGWITGILSINLGFLIALICALKLVQCAIKTKITTY